MKDPAYVAAMQELRRSSASCPFVSEKKYNRKKDKRRSKKNDVW